ncbi:enoyl-CoA hydratase/isomerase family protein [Rhodococcus sp. NPDC057014]|uniref:enoyl-CoA hydratase/isomerase family protein n=1 Tax=Rhodococcus sp. NPDC057014 TaxID=3346000 RepID=UPI003635FCC9
MVTTARQGGHIASSHADGTATIVIDRPEARNAFTSELYTQLKAAVRRAGDDPTVDVAVITGAGGSFSSGADLHAAFTGLAEEGPSSGYAWWDELPWPTLLDCPIPVIAAVEGPCIGAGLLIALAADTVVAADTAQFAFAEARVGIADRWAPALMDGRVPRHIARELLLTGRTVGADEACRIGLVHEVVSHDALGEVVAEKIIAFRRTSPHARALYKRYLADLVDRPTEPGIRAALEHSDAAEGMRAVLERRVPAWSPR